MNTVAIAPESDNQNVPQYRAVSGNHQSVGRTMGEALDALAGQIPESEAGALILIQRRGPDRFFTADQFRRMKDLMDRRDQLSAAEQAELEALVDAELSATVSRTGALVQQLTP